MSNEWFEIAWINFTKAILHGQRIDDAGREVQIERVLTDAVLCSKRTKAMTDVLPCGDERIADGDAACAAPTSGVSYRGIC